MKKGKKYLAAEKAIDATKLYTIAEAAELVKTTSTTKFDSTIDVSFHLNVDPKQADQQIRGTVILPHGNGKTKKVLAITHKVDEATAAGADYVGDVDLLTKIEKENFFDFDVMIATPDMMPALGKLGKILGPKGLMPNPKTGTVTTQVEKAVTDAKAGRVEYRTDSYGNVHGVIGKVSFKDEDLLENLDAFVKTILKAKPTTVKGTYVKNIALCATMTPSVKIDTNSFDK